MVDNTPLYFRGKLIVDQVMQTLMKDYEMDKAAEIVLTGCSAGGLSTYYHADYLGQFFTKNIPTLQK